MRDGVSMDLSRDAVGLEDISSRLAHKKVCNVTLKKNRNKLSTAVNMAEELVKSGRLHAEGDCAIIRSLCTGYGNHGVRLLQ